MKLFLILVLCYAAFAAAQDWAGPGPCTSTVTYVKVKLPPYYICKCQCAVRLVVTTPADGCAYSAPYPTVIFTSGFQATSINYQAYAERLASWGFAVLQYDFLALSPWIDALCHSDAAEAGFMLKFLKQLRQVTSDPAQPLYGKLDLDNLGAAGHSRGGKIAALHYAGMTPNVRAAYLVDPVDGFAFTQGMLGYPSAVMLLKGRDKKLGITGAGKIGLCNGAPLATGNWTQYWEVSAPGSELSVVLNAGHLQFVNISSQWDKLCCPGCKNLVSRKEGIELALAPMVAWFQRELRGQNPELETGLAGFKQWVCSQQAAQKLWYVVRGAGPVCPALSEASAMLGSAAGEGGDNGQSPVKKGPLFRFEYSESDWKN